MAISSPIDLLRQLAVDHLVHFPQACTCQHLSVIMCHKDYYISQGPLWTVACHHFASHTFYSCLWCRGSRVSDSTELASRFMSYQYCGYGLLLPLPLVEETIEKGPAQPYTLLQSYPVRALPTADIDPIPEIFRNLQHALCTIRPDQCT